MGWASDVDQGVVSVDARTPGERIMTRTLAVILFVLGAPFGLVLPIAIAGAIIPGLGFPKSSWGMVLTFGVVAVVCVWLAVVLWTGRSIPRWFLATFFYVPPIGFGLACLIQGDLENASLMLGMSTVFYCTTGPGLLPPKAKNMPEL